MNPTLLHIWGPFSIHAYGFFIAMGSVFAILLAKHDAKLKKIISFQDFLTSVQIIVASGVIGGKLLCLMSESIEEKNILSLFKFWEPGLSVQGAIIGAIAGLYFYTKTKKIPFLSFIDRIAIYALLVHAFGRIGCFFAGCCYGKTTTLFWSVTYKHPDHMAPLNIALHPTQLYSSLLFFLIFIFLYFYLQNKSSKPGLLFFSYLTLVSMERFIVDFFRADQTWITNSEILQYFSINQWISLAIMLLGIIGLIFTQKRA